MNSEQKKGLNTILDIVRANLVGVELELVESIISQFGNLNRVGRGIQVESLKPKTAKVSEKANSEPKQKKAKVVVKAKTVKKAKSTPKAKSSQKSKTAQNIVERYLESKPDKTKTVKTAFNMTTTKKAKQQPKAFESEYKHICKCGKKYKSDIGYKRHLELKVLCRNGAKPKARKEGQNLPINQTKTVKPIELTAEVKLDKIQNTLKYIAGNSKKMNKNDIVKIISKLANF